MDEELDDELDHNINLGRKMTYMGKDSYEDAISTLNLCKDNVM
jgi:hypothetical protein